MFQKRETWQEMHGEKKEGGGGACYPFWNCEYVIPLPFWDCGGPQEERCIPVE